MNIEPLEGRLMDKMMVTNHPPYLHTINKTIELTTGTEARLIGTAIHCLVHTIYTFNV